MNRTMKRIVGIILAAALVVGCGIWASDARLKATESEEVPETVERLHEEEYTEVTVEENEDYSVSVMVSDVEPAEAPEELSEETPEEKETEEIPVEEPEEEIPEEETPEELPEEEAPEEETPEELPEELPEEKLPEEEPAEEAEEDAPEETPEETLPEEGPEEDPDAGKAVRIWSDRKDVMTVGDTVHLYSELTGFDGIKVRYQWQCDKGDEKGFVDVADATGAVWEFKATEETMNYRWRLVIDY